MGRRASKLGSLHARKNLIGSLIYESVFSASLGPRERLLTYAVGYGVGIGVPFILGISFAVGFSQPLLLLFPVPFVLAFGATYFFRPTGYAVSSSEIAVIRAIGRKRIPLEAICEILSPATSPPGISIGLARVEGIHGTFGSYWNKTWGRYQVFVTNHLNTVEVRLQVGSRVMLSPDDPMAFIDAVRKATLELGITIEVNCV
jgi:hypothetical protein